MKIYKIKYILETELTDKYKDELIKIFSNQKVYGKETLTIIDKESGEVVYEHNEL